MDFLFAILSFFLGAFITICIYKLLELMFPKVLFKISPESTPKDGGRFNFYLRKWKMPIGWSLFMCLFCYITDLVTRFLYPSYFGFWKAWLIIFLGASLITPLIGLNQYFFDSDKIERNLEYKEWIEQQGDTEK